MRGKMKQGKDNEPDWLVYERHLRQKRKLWTYCFEILASPMRLAEGRTWVLFFVFPLLIPFFISLPLFWLILFPIWLYQDRAFPWQKSQTRKQQIDLHKKTIAKYNIRCKDCVQYIACLRMTQLTHKNQLRPCTIFTPIPTKEK
jgi:hypothetical protein